MTGLSETSIRWRGLTLSGAFASPFVITSLSGWDGLPSVRRSGPARPAGHGRFSAPGWADERIVIVGGFCHSASDRDALLVELSSVMTWPTSPGGLDDLTVEHAGRGLTASAELTAFVPEVTENWSMGHFPFVVEWRCPDPLRYGPRASVSTTFPAAAGGLQYPLYTDGTDVTGWLDYGEPSATGRVELHNPGTADSWPQFEVTGPVSSAGFEIVTVGTGARLRFEGGVPAGSVLVLDSATGAVAIDGSADRGGLLTWRDWAPVPAGGSAQFVFVPLGSESPAVLTASVRPAYW